jgi:DNA polymerase III delta prime subunit
MGYIKRIIDNELKSLENYNIMISVSGVKGCGKTETATRFAKTVFTVNETLNQRNLLELNPELILAGEKPHLIDEWQIQP